MDRFYVENAAAAVALAVTDARAAGRTYNIGQATALTEQAWIEEIAAQVGWQGEIRCLAREHLPALLAQPYNWSHDLAADTRRFRQELGFNERVSWPEALQRTVDWERANPPSAPGNLDYAAEDLAVC